MESPTSALQSILHATVQCTPNRCATRMNFSRVDHLNVTAHPTAIAKLAEKELIEECKVDLKPSSGFGVLGLGQCVHGIFIE
eukprot:6348557-Amphidinium_carterae.1